MEFPGTRQLSERARRRARPRPSGGPSVAFWTALLRRLRPPALLVVLPRRAAGAVVLVLVASIGRRVSRLRVVGVRDGVVGVIRAAFGTAPVRSLASGVGRLLPALRLLRLLAPALLLAPLLLARVRRPLRILAPLRGRRLRGLRPLLGVAALRPLIAGVGLLTAPLLAAAPLLARVVRRTGLCGAF